MTPIKEVIKTDSSDGFFARAKEHARIMDRGEKPAKIKIPGILDGYPTKHAGETRTSADGLDVFTFLLCLYQKPSQLC